MGPNLIALAIPIFFLMIGVELAVARRLKRPVYRLGDALADMGCGVAQQVGVLFYAGALLAAYGFVYDHARLFTLPGWGQWVLAFLGVDFTYYWWHRLSHEVNLLWAAHGVHHQSEDYNLAVALRQSVTTTATIFPFYVTLAFLGVPVLPFAVATSLSTLYQFWIHTELVPPLPRFEKLFNSPSAHRVHHAINVQYLDKNHAATLLIWDRLFGTWAPEVEPPIYGITKPLGSFNPVWAQFAGYFELFRLARRAPNPWLAVQVFFRSPAWHPPWMGESYSPPASREVQQRYDVAPSAFAKRYALAWFAALVAGTFGLLMWGGDLTLLQLAAVALGVYLTLLAISGTLEGRRWVKVLEPLRYAALLGVAVMLVT